jgi:hypothetical protein
LVRYRCFEIGQTGGIDKHWFRVVARVVYEGEDGAWREWCLELQDGSLAWLEQEDGQTILMRKQRLTTAVPAFNQIQVGMRFQVNGAPFFVVERNRARVSKIEGELPFGLHVGQSVLFVDGNIDGRPALLDYGAAAANEYGIGEIIESNGI